MRTRIWSAALLALSFVTASCSDSAPVGPVLTPAPQPLAVSALPAVRISEIHYDNAGTDAGESIEVSGPAGTDLTGWRVVLYNGSNGAPYDTRTLSGTISATCGRRGVVVLTYPVNGIQNGDPDGIALIDAGGQVVEFLSYEGTFAAVGGPANGMASADIGAAETSSTPTGQSLQRNGAGTWAGPSANTFGACNDETPAQSVPRLAELHYDNAGTDAGEAVEVEGDAGFDLTGWSVVLYNASTGVVYSTQALSGTIPATCGARGVVVVTYPVNGIQNGDPDGLALVDAAGLVVEFLSYEGTFAATDGPAAGMISTDIGVAETSSTPAGHSLQRTAAGVWQAPAPNSFGACNGGGGPPPPPPPPGGNSIAFVGRSVTADPPLPVGFQDQLFANVTDASGAPVATTITWSSATPALASVDRNGIVTALGAGTAVIRATAADGTTATFSLPTSVATASTVAQYGQHLEFGAPADDTPADEFLVVRPQFVSSFNRFRGTPNWVAYNLEATHVGAQDRCDCFTPDPQLPGSFPTILTSDYTGSGYSRGHLVKSQDRSAGALDNATTFYFTNIIPQTSANNGGAWLDLENDLTDLARTGTREIYVVAGGAGSLGTLKSEGRVNIPASTWKVAVVMPRDQGLRDIDDPSDFELIAINIPNTATGVGGSWTSFRTSVDALEALTGYDLLALLPDAIETVVEAQVGTRNVEMDVQPSNVSLSATPVVNVVLLSRAGFDAQAVDAAAARLAVNGGAVVAPVVRGTAVNTTVHDFNGDGLPDRQIVFRTSDLVAAGLSTARHDLVLRLAGTTWPWEARDPALPVIVP